MKNLYLREVSQRLALGSVLACCSLGLISQIGCGGAAHQPPPADEAALQQEAKEQLDIRAMETGGGKK